MRYHYPLKTLLFLLLFIPLVSCKTKQQVPHTEIAPQLPPAVSVTQILHKKEPDFNTLKINGTIEYTSGDDSQTAGIDIRIIKDQKILISVSYFIPVLKIMLTPESVNYYDIVHKTYYKGDYSVIKNILNTDFTFNQIQNALIGLPVCETTTGSAIFSAEDNFYRAESKLSGSVSEELWWTVDYLLAKQRIKDSGIIPYMLDISYVDHTPYSNFFIPKRIKITAEKKEKHFMNITYNTCKINEDFTFNFHIPKEYKSIEID